jgi:uncharacterized phage protein gp47/JayE
MAYENMTYEYILNRMMSRVTEKYPNLDTREGSILFNALAPAAIELAIMYTELDNVLHESFVDTASREYLLLGCAQIGMDTSMFEATAGVHKAQFNTKVTVGSRWNCELYNYTVSEYIGLENARYSYRVICETTGAEPNKVTGDLTPITDAPSNLTYAKLVECLIEGESESSDDEIRLAYHEFIDSVATDGNVAQYERWCSEYDGIGNYIITPLWNGDNTVKVSILSSSNLAASAELIAEFQEYLDPNSEGMGNGVAPIGSVVTVDTAQEHDISVEAIVKMKNGYDTSTSVDKIKKAIREYFASISYKTNIVSYLGLGAAILAVDGVLSISKLQLDDDYGTYSSDITLDANEIPVLYDVGEPTIEVI